MGPSTTESLVSIINTELKNGQSAAVLHWRRNITGIRMPHVMKRKRSIITINFLVPLSSSPNLYQLPQWYLWKEYDHCIHGCLRNSEINTICAKITLNKVTRFYLMAKKETITRNWWKGNINDDIGIILPVLYFYGGIKLVWPWHSSYKDPD